MVLHPPAGSGPDCRCCGSRTGESSNHVRFDFIPDDQQVEIKPLLKMGAHHVDIGQGELSWVVLADPEGNESARSGGHGPTGLS